MQNHVRPEGLIPGNSGHGTPAETAPRSAAPEAPAPACGFPREKTVCRGFFLPGTHAFPAFCRCAPTAYFTPYFSLFPENSPRVRPRTSPRLSPGLSPGYHSRPAPLHASPFFPCVFPVFPGAPSSPRFQPAPGPSLFRHSLSRSPAPACAFRRRLPFRTACARKSPSLFPVRCSGFARRLCGMRRGCFPCKTTRNYVGPNFLQKKADLKFRGHHISKKNIKQYAAVYLLDISIRNFSLKHLAILGKISSTSRKTAQPA